jgi:hypothetical protein
MALILRPDEMSMLSLLALRIRSPIKTDQRSDFARWVVEEKLIYWPFGPIKSNQLLIYPRRATPKESRPCRCPQVTGMMVCSAQNSLTNLALSKQGVLDLDLQHRSIDTHD